LLGATGCNLFLGSSGSPGVIISFGDSITQHFYATDPGVNDYVSLLGADLHLTVINNALSGDQAADMSLKVHKNSTPDDSNSTLYTTMIGINDSNHYGADPDKQQTFQYTLAASLAWLAIPRAQKIFAQDPQLTFSESWSPDNTVVNGLGIASHTQGDVAQLSLTTNGAPIYIAYKILDGNRGTVSVNIDGVDSGRLCSCGVNGSAITTYNSPIGSGIALARYPVAPGSHNIKLTVTSPTSAQNAFCLEWLATPGQSTSCRVFAGGITREQNDAHEPLNSQYNEMVQSTIANLKEDGLALCAVPTRSYLNTTTDMHDTLHPNNAGHAQLHTAFLSVITASQTSP
jgi:lysophospholipase L1-like esterase